MQINYLYVIFYLLFVGNQHVGSKGLGYLLDSVVGILGEG